MKHTITRLGETKTINYTNKRTGKPDSFNKIGFLSEEGGQQWHDFTFRGQHGLVVGQSYDFDVTPREYNGKTYYDAKLAKNGNGTEKLGGASTARLENLLSLKLIPLLERICVALEGKSGQIEGYPERDETNTPDF